MNEEYRIPVDSTSDDDESVEPPSGSERPPSQEKP
jgi:hypothetical protein